MVELIGSLCVWRGESTSLSDGDGHRARHSSLLLGACVDRWWATKEVAVRSPSSKTPPRHLDGAHAFLTGHPETSRDRVPESSRI